MNKHDDHLIGSSLRRWFPFALLGACMSVPAIANPTGPVVVQGQASFSQQGNILTVTNSPDAIINWQSFSIGAGEIVRFISQSGSASVLNRVVGVDPSTILGDLQSNGNVALLLPNGALVGNSATINVAGLTLSTAPQSDGGVSTNGASLNIGGMLQTGGNLNLAAANITLNGAMQTGGTLSMTAGNTVAMGENFQLANGGITTVTAPVVSNSTVGALTVAHVTAPTQSLLTLTSGSVAFAPTLEPGWNLLGNSLSVAIDVAATLGNRDAPIPGVTENIVSVWKWNAATSQWAFYSPQLTVAQIHAYALARGFEVLGTLNPREGCWISAQASFALPPVIGAPAEFGHAEFSSLPPGFNLIVIGSQKTPTEFNTTVAQPPNPGAPNLTSLWGWDTAQQRWYFYSPLLESSGGLAAVKAYVESHGLLHFADRNKLLGVGVGFWVNKP